MLPASLWDMSTWADERLIAAYRAGQRRALEVLLRRHERSIRRICERMAGAPEAARELQQETMLGIVRNIDGYRGDAAFLTWAFAIARSFAHRQRRRARSAARLDTAYRSASEMSPASSEGNPEVTIDRARLQDLVETALRTLSKLDRDVLLARDFEGYTASETAERLELTVSAVKSRLHRARSQLRATLRVSVSPAR